MDILDKLDKNYNNFELDKDLKIRKGTVEHDFRTRKIMDLYLQHNTFNEICKKLNISLHIVKKTIQDCISGWEKLDRDKIRQLAYKELLKIDKIEAEMWEAWNASKGKPKKSTMTAISGGIERDKATGKVTNDKMTPRSKRVEVTEDERFSGDMQYMETIKWCMKRRSELLAMDLPKKFVETADLEGNKTKAEYVREEILTDIRKIVMNKQKQLAITDGSYVEGELIDETPNTHKVLGNDLSIANILNKTDKIEDE